MPCVPPAEERRCSVSFNPRNAQYSCCFQHLHANKGSLLIAAVHVAIASGVLAWVVRTLAQPSKSRLEAAFELSIATLCLAASLVLIVGLRLESRRLLTVYISCQVAAISLLFILFLALIMGIKPGILDDPNHDGYNTLEEEMLIVLEILVSLAVVGVEVWFLTIVLKSYRYITDKYHYTGVDREYEV